MCVCVEGGGGGLAWLAAWLSMLFALSPGPLRPDIASEEVGNPGQPRVKVAGPPQVTHAQWLAHVDAKQHLTPTCRPSAPPRPAPPRPAPPRPRRPAGSPRGPRRDPAPHLAAARARRAHHSGRGAQAEVPLLRAAAGAIKTGGSRAGGWRCPCMRAHAVWPQLTFAPPLLSSALPCSAASVLSSSSSAPSREPAHQQAQYA